MGFSTEQDQEMFCTILNYFHEKKQEHLLKISKKEQDIQTLEEHDFSKGNPQPVLQILPKTD